jgi:murein DD-endopeptidase MepM/ murein hydrolase activator NlpD
MKISEKASLHTLFPNVHFTGIAIPDMSVGSNFFGNDPQHENLELAAARLQDFQDKNPESLLANGYLEERSFYNTKRFERIINGITEFRNIHLGTDFWLPAGTAVHVPFDGTVVISHYNNFHKDYGALIVVQHTLLGNTIYTLYGHLSKDSLALSPKGKQLKQGEFLAYLGNEDENGHWLPHLHFQLITDLLGETENYNGVAFPSEIDRWKTLCPDPDLIFEESLH